MKLRERIAVVTGASSGIGRATAVALAAEGAHLALAARNAATLEETAAVIRAMGREAQAISTDVTHRQDIQHLVDETLSRWGRIDILVASAGAYVRSRVVELSLEQVERAFAVNFYGSLYAVLAVLPPMLRQRSGHLVLVNSMDARKGLPLDAPYAASKCALAGFAGVMRQELRGTGIATTTVFPGRVDTPKIDSLRVPWISAKIPAETVARAIVRAIYHPQAEVYVPHRVRALAYLNAVSPRLADRVVAIFHLQGWETDTLR